MFILFKNNKFTFFYVMINYGKEIFKRKRKNGRTVMTQSYTQKPWFKEILRKRKMEK